MSKQLTDADLTRMGCANELSDTERGQLIGEVIRLQGVNVALLAACQDARAIFTKDHAMDRFNWSASALRSQDIRELNELPIKLYAAISAANS